jgi:stage V sporulation protein D (sporulation-specific penicillin-binding protein)
VARQGNGISTRLGVVIVLLLIATLGLVGRLAHLQIVSHREYQEQAQDEHQGSLVLNPRRGAILDCNGYPLAASVDAYDVMVDSQVWEDSGQAQQRAEALADVLDRPPQHILTDLSTSITREVIVGRGLDYQGSLRVDDLGLPGVRLVRTSRRVYPEGNLAASLIGFIGRDNVGLTGLEADYDRDLSGAAGSLSYERDGMGNKIALGYSEQVPPEPGADIVLTIDRYMQRMAERELDATIEKHEADGGTIIIMDPHTGSILAMASRPSFDLTNLDLSDESKMDLYRNRAITDLYEPGSVFKTITMAGALDAGLVSPESVYVDEGVAHISGWTIVNWDFGAHGTQTATQILVKSLNTGAVWLSELLEPGRFYDYVYRFGFGQATGVDLSGEAAGQVRTPAEDNWSEVDMATNSFGQGINVTPLQLITAISAIANDGKLVQPYVVQEIRHGDERQMFQPLEVRQVVTAEAANTLTHMMNAVVDGITTVYAISVPGYQVAGKTGTASISVPGGYKEDAYIASFAGFVPSDDPALAILVKIDEPKDVPWGSAVCAPVFARMAQSILNYLKVPPAPEALVHESP